MLSKKDKTKSENDLSERFGLVYARVSSKRQEIEGSGLQSQEGRCQKELTSMRIPYTRSFLDSYSGGGDYMNRPAMRELLAYIDDHPHKKWLVIFDDLSRFARDVMFHLKLRAEFKKRDVVLKCLNYNFDESEEGSFVELIFSGKAELDRKQNRRQVVQKMKARLEAGYWPFGGKKGYVIEKDSEHGKIAKPHPVEADILKTALEGFSSGRFPRKVDACAYLVEQGFWKRQKPERYIDKFSAMAGDAFYAGYTEYPSWEVEMRVGKHKGIISLDTLMLNRKRLNKGDLTKRIRKDISEDFSFRGLIVCDGCGSHLTAGWSQGRKSKYAYYLCQNTSCDSYRVSLPAIDIEKRFKELLLKNTLKEEVGSVVDVIFDRVWKEEVLTFKKSEKSSLDTRKVLEEDIKSIADLAHKAKSEAIRSAYEMQLESKMKVLEEVEEPVASLDFSTPYQTALDKSKLFLKSPYVAWSELGLMEKHQLFYFIFDQKLAYNKKNGYQTAEIPTAIRLFEEFVTTNPRDVEMAGIEPACKWVFEKFLQRVVCFKCLNSMSMKQTKSHRIDLLQFRTLSKRKYPESQDITPSSCYETLQDLMSLRLKRKRKQNP